jgi:hypothetical protein
LAAQPGFRTAVALGVVRVTGGVGGRVDQRPAQVLGTVLGQRVAVVLALGLVDPRAKACPADLISGCGRPSECLIDTI